MGKKFLVTDHKLLVSLFSSTKGTPALASNWLARCNLTMSQYNYSIEHRRTADHSNADALTHLPTEEVVKFEEKEEVADVSTICTIKAISWQLNPTHTGVMSKEAGKDPIFSTVKCYVKEGWSHNFLQRSATLQEAIGFSDYGELMPSFWSKVVIPDRQRKQVLQLLYLGHFGMQRRKQLACSVLYWPHINDKIENLCQTYSACAEHQNKLPKPTNHPWMLPEKSCSRLHLDHAINFLSTNWLVLVNTYSKHPCIHPPSSTLTTDLLDVDFAHFGYSHTLVTTRYNFSIWGISSLVQWTRFCTPHQTAISPCYERCCRLFGSVVQTVSEEILIPPKAALLEFSIHFYSLLDSGHSPSKMLNGHQIRCKLDTLLPSLAHTAQGKQARETVKSQQR